jgi:hypothetical protein
MDEKNCELNFFVIIIVMLSSINDKSNSFMTTYFSMKD